MTRVRIDLGTGTAASGILVCQLRFTLEMHTLDGSTMRATFLSRWMPPSKLRGAGIELSQGSSALALEMGGLASTATCDERGYDFTTDNGAMRVRVPTADFEGAHDAILSSLSQLSDKAIVIPPPSQPGAAAGQN